MDHGRVIRRHELSDAEWELVQPLLPRPVLGRPRLDDRTVLNGIVWKFRTGVAWRDVPDRYGAWASLHTRFRRWASDGTFERMLQAAQAQADAAGDIESSLCSCYSPTLVPLRTLVRVAGSRWRVEEFFQSGKGLTALDEHQVRRYPSWSRGVTLAMLAHTRCRWRRRVGRRGLRVVPSARSSGDGRPFV
ncbi:transposase [Streptomyces sp. NPDC058682]|uniref:transposase n=1 Tax=Streptomyces sp. NPDC058682 TaxID=3346596 RepID=UPI00366807A9